LVIGAVLAWRAATYRLARLSVAANARNAYFVESIGVGSVVYANACSRQLRITHNTHKKTLTVVAISVLLGG